MLQITRLSRALFLLISILTAFACTSTSETPESAIKNLLRQAGEAAEAKDLRALSRFIAEEYRDEQGRDRQALRGVLQYYFLANQSIYLLTRVRSVEFPEAGRAEVVVLAALAGEPLADASEPSLLRATLHRFEFSLVEEGKNDWKVISARWRPTDLRGFLGGE